MKKLLFVSAAIIAFGYCHAQSLAPTVVASQGDYYSSTSGSVSWTLGEIMIEKYSDANNILTQGFQQPKHFITSVPIIEGVSSSSIYPNPFSNLLNVNLSLPKGQIQIFTILGVLVGTWTLSSGKSEIDVSNLAGGIYIATIINSENNKRQSYKINKSE